LTLGREPGDSFGKQFTFFQQLFDILLLLQQQFILSSIVHFRQLRFELSIFSHQLLLHLLFCLQLFHLLFELLLFLD
jgi:hypothetical protein